MDASDHRELIKDYVEDSMEFLDELDSLLLRLEQMVGETPNAGLVGQILGLLHTFKGNSGLMGYPSLQKYAHKLEDLFNAVKSESTDLDSALADYLMQCATVLRGVIAKISPERPEESDLEEDLARLEQIVAEKVKSKPSGPGVSATVAREIFDPFAKKSDLLKVDFHRLDHLLNLMGELAIYRTRLGRIDTQFIEAYGESAQCLDLRDTSEQIGKITTELHEAIMKVRMLPIRQVLMRFPRLVRDLARENEKEIELIFQGEETELDKTVVDEIGKPLMHLIRNAIDHGIESPKEREALGKPRRGTIEINAYQESSHIFITVTDDGRGIDEESLREKAEQSGLLPPDEMAQPSLMDLLFLPGLSTAETVTEISGRGLGMDVVRTSMNKISGSIEVESNGVGQGTQFTIKLPLTLAIIAALMVEVAGEEYAIPLASVVESIKVESEEIHGVNHRELIKVRDRVLPLARLAGLFGLGHSTNGRNIYVVITQAAGAQMGIIVDRLMGRQEIVIKPLDDYLGSDTGVAGATILGDGKVVLIVDVPSLLDRFRYHETEDSIAGGHHA